MFSSPHTHCLFSCVYLFIPFFVTEDLNREPYITWPRRAFVIPFYTALFGYIFIFDNLIFSLFSDYRFESAPFFPFPISDFPINSVRFCCCCDPSTNLLLSNNSRIYHVSVCPSLSVFVSVSQSEEIPLSLCSPCLFYSDCSHVHCTRVLSVRFFIVFP